MAKLDIEPCVVLTGAGISAESGIPTFRGDGGIWEKYRATELATPESFQRDPQLVTRFYNWRRGLVSQCQPNRAHLALASIEDEAADFTLITQNIDGLHQAAGSRNVLELHGSIWRLRCTSCQDRWEDRRAHIPELVPRCPGCDGLARPDVVWFGETLDPEILQQAQRAAERARTMLVIGTSAVVYPAAELPLVARYHGARLLEFNLEKTPLTPYADETLLGPATEQLPAWWERTRANI